MTTVKQLRERLEGLSDDASVFLWGMNSSRDDGAGQIEVRCGVDDGSAYAAALIDVEADPDA